MWPLSWYQFCVSLPLEVRTVGLVLFLQVLTVLHCLPPACHVEQVLTVLHCLPPACHVEQVLTVLHCLPPACHVEQVLTVLHCLPPACHVEQVLTVLHCLPPAGHVEPVFSGSVFSTSVPRRNNSELYNTEKKVLFATCAAPVLRYTRHDLSLETAATPPPPSHPARLSHLGIARNVPRN